MTSEVFPANVVGMRTALVTGANSGIGRATALALAQEGYRVFAAMRSVEKAEKLLGLAAKAGVAVEPVALDVTDADSVRSAFEKVHAECDALDVLVNNAGLGCNATTEDLDIDHAKVVFDTNYWGIIRCIQAALPKMRERGSGNIVNVSSVAGRIAALGQVVYSSSKWAVECLSENLAQEIAPFGLRVIVIEPGVTRTAIFPKNGTYPTPTVYEAAYRRMLQFYAKGIEASTPAEEVAATIAAALADPDPKLRYTCSWGSAEIAAGRTAMSDEDWVDLGRAQGDAEYYEGFARHFGLKLD
ncbi:MAG: SDR family oxidoreductase [Candidatus Binatia bacterium]|nr:SDR family oxidoreductase [Candidatus Binatia bacterium]